ncbi:DUF637 domain-containing protein [Pseudomonas cerasi]|uniref:Adhesin/filamentous hemagglutinin, ShlA/HecA/FhaA family n=1 Tax=Pseudomonas cerasi TaxID=1583341 RepID=A0A193SNU6_9PSED|nr:DUF637 domain-containing protein [Pseudomonas cerasi]CZT28705.1 Adhesin/filamentous hemagglutinin, ShlA/HecA/FhaA family [Pseudomonas cerasi]SOS19822.1 Adhesin/filamentous hemagglutinin, ShlA/HecA/FhaA family [Pseudomonas cerasi]
MTPALRRCCFICLLQNLPSFAARFSRGLSDQGIKHLRNEFLYLAQADNRLGPTGALIAGNDVSLIAGQNLDNVGTLHAANNLSAVAGNNLIITGLIEAGNRLDLLAGNDLINTAGGIIKGRDVSLTAINGDVINERSITSMDNSVLGQRHNEFADSAARIEAANDMSISAGRDVINKGSVLQSGRDMSIQAGRDVTIAPTEVTNSLFSDSKHNSSDITQLGSTASSGRDLTVQAGRDISVIASQIDAKRDIAMAATENLTISSAADEEHSLSKSKKLTRQEDHVSQVAADLDAGGSVALQAGQNLAVISSRITAGKEAYLVAGENLDILAAQDSDYSLYDKKKKGSFGAKNFKRDEVTDTRNISSEITTGGNLTLASGGDQRYQVAKLNSGNDLLINSGGAIDFEGVKDLHDESHTKNKSSAAWFSTKGKGATDETFRQSELVAKGEVAIQAVNGLRIDVKQVNQQSVSQSIDAMVKADPQLAWIKDAEKRGDIDWRQVKEIHESFKYDNSGLGPAAQIVVAILMAAVMGPAGFGLSAGIGGAVATSVATTAVTSTINNKGDLGAVFKDVTSSNAIKGYAMAGVMAGFVPTINPKNLGLDLASVQTVATKVITESVIKTAIMGGSFKDNLGSSIVSTGIATGGAIAAGKIGDFTLFDEGKLTKVGMHAVLGGLMSETMGGDFRTGALAAGANEMVVDYLAERMLPSDLDKNSQAYQAGVSKLMTASQLIGALTAAATGGDASVAAAVTANSTQYNYLAHNQLKEAAEKLRKCAPAECDSIVAAYKKVSEDQTIEAIINCRFDVSLCKPSSRDVANTVADLSSVYDALGDGSKYAKDSLQILINENLEFQETLAVATTGASAQAVAETLQAKLKLTPEETVELAEAIGGGLAAAAGGVVAFRRVLAKASTRLERDGGSSVNKPVVDRTVDTLQDAGKQESSTAGMNAGAARRLDYEGAPYHGKVDNAVKSRAPVNGQDALDTSIQVKITSPRRVGIDYDSGEFVVFDKTLDTTYNGHVRSWGDLHADMQRALQQAGMVDRKGKILIGGDR